MKHKVESEWDDEANAISAGLRMSWLSGESDTDTINLTCGAGVGSPFMVFSLTPKKEGAKTRYAVADIRPMVKSLAKILGGDK